MQHLFAEYGTSHYVEGNRPIVIADHDSLWYVASGQIDLFAVAIGQEKDGTRDKRRYLFSLEEGALLFGFDARAGRERTALLLTAPAGTRVDQLSRKQFLQYWAEGRLDARQLSRLVEQWVSGWSAALSMRHAPSEFRLLEQSHCQELEAGHIWRSLETLWVKLLSDSSELYWSSELPVPQGQAAYVPLTSSGWLETRQAAAVEVRDTPGWLEEDRGLEGLYFFHQVIADRLADLFAKERAQEHERFLRRTEHDHSLMDHAIKRLLAVTGEEELRSAAFQSADPLYRACRAVGDYAGMAIRPATRQLKLHSTRAPIQELAQASGVRTRRVILKGEWWREDHGPLVAFTELTAEPVALIPTSPSSYSWENTASGERGAVDAQNAAGLSPTAYMLYRTLPARALGVKDIVKFSMHRTTRRDLAVLLLTGALAGVLGILLPAATGMLVDTIIPESFRGPLVQMGFILLAAVLSAALFRLGGAMAAQRMEGRVEHAVQAAIWDRLLQLPVSFFRHYTAGDLASRAGSINVIRQLLSGAAIGSLLTGVFSTFQYGLLFYYDSGLALIAGGLVLVAMSFTVAIGLLQVRYQRKLLDLQGRISGTVLQLLNGVSKFRMAAAERRAFFLWARAFAEQKRLSFRARMLENYAGVFQSFFPLAASMVLFYLAASQQSGLSAGQFIAFFAAFTSFLASMLAMASTLLSVVHIVPLYERAKPILKALPEFHEQLEDPGTVSGAVEIRHLQFSYGQEQPLVLQDVTLHIKAGQYVAFVGASGCGKSTLMRLLLGFEQPLGGSVFYDGQDLRSLDVHLLRSQFGVVLQNSKLMSGDIYSNIVGSSELTLEEAWEAAAMAGLDDDVRSMPMAMHTVISEGGGSLSGGQRQRLMIARAIARRPKILFFDEATSALDNRTQRIVSESLAKLQATRIVIAHRLSTITQADQIYVMDKGRIVQAGTYEQLLRQPGLFAELASRQLA